MVSDGINIVLLVLAVFIALIALGLLYRCQFSRNKSLSVVILVIICVILLFAYFVNQYQNCCYWRKSSEKNWDLWISRLEGWCLSGVSVRALVFGPEDPCFKPGTRSHYSWQKLCIVNRVSSRLTHGYQINYTGYLCIIIQFKVGLTKIQHS